MKLCYICKLPKRPKSESWNFHHIGVNYYHDDCWEKRIADKRNKKIRIHRAVKLFKVIMDPSLIFYYI